MARERISILANKSIIGRNGADLTLYSDDQVTKKFEVDGATGTVFPYRRKVVAKTADYTCTAADSGTFFTTVGDANDIEFTLAAVATAGAGWHAWFFRAGSDHELLITAPDETLIAHNDATADAISFTTAGEQIGNGFYIVCDGTYYIACPIYGAEDSTVTVTSA